MAIEQAIGDAAVAIAELLVARYPNDEPDEWKKAARELRFPYVVLLFFRVKSSLLVNYRFWDWAAKKVASNGVPTVLTDENISIVLPDGSSEQAPNPLAFYSFEEKIPNGFADAVISVR